MPAGWPRKVQPIRRGRCRREPAPSFATTTIMTAMIPLDQGVSKFGDSAGGPSGPECVGLTALVRTCVFGLRHTLNPARNRNEGHADLPAVQVIKGPDQVLCAPASAA